MFKVGTSMVKGRQMKYLNPYLNNSAAWLRAFLGSLVKNLQHYVIPTLTEKIHDHIIIHRGCPSEVSLYLGVQWARHIR